MRKWVWVSVILAALLTGYAVAFAVRPAVPPVKAYAEGREIQFLHTEVSDPKIAKLLSEMMRSPVLVVPELAQAPEALLANVYVFTNGVRGKGPLKFQPDVFDVPPPSGAYRPLRVVNLLTWKHGRLARVLKSASEVRAAEAAGELTIERSGIVANMPLVTWPGGGR